MDRSNGMLKFNIWILILLTTKPLCRATKGFERNNTCVSVPKCRCTVNASNGTLANCYNLSLTSVPHFSNNVTSIDLSYNKIEIFNGYGNLPKGLVFLDISFNYINNFQNRSFDQLIFLETLNLKNNRLPLNSRTYTVNLFKDLVNLKKLNLKNNVRKDFINQSYPDNSFSKLISLETLEIDGLSNGQFGPGFSRLKNLRSLNISGVTGKCSVPLLTQTYFKYLPQLEIVDASHCKIYRVENGTFRGLKKLEVLDLSYNEDLTFRVCRNVTFDLQFTPIKLLKFNKIHQTFGVGTELFVKDVEYLSNTSVEELYLDSNRLEVVEMGVMTKIPHTVSYISAADNKFTMGIYVLQTSVVKGVKVFNGSKQYSSHDPTSLFKPTDPNSCDIQERQTCKIYPSQKSSYNLRNLDKSMAVYKEIFQKFKLGIDITIPISPNLETIYFSNCRLRYEIPKLILSEINKITYADFSGNILYSWKGPIKNLKKIKFLDLSNNYCSYVSTKFFEDFRQLETLNLKSNLLGFSLSEDKFGMTFGKLKNVKRLDLSGNHIRYLQEYFFTGLQKLEILNISRNLLREWSFDIGNMPFLRYVDISQNQLVDLPQRVRNNLDRHALDRNVTIDMSDNNLICSCNKLNFLKWILHTKVNFRNWENYECIFSNSTVMKFKDLTEAVLKMDIECTSKIGLIAGVLAAVLVSLIIIVVGIVYRYRWKIRYLYYTTKNRYLGYNAIVNDDRDDDFIYDAFVSYADEDRAFVSNDMCKYLEEENGHKLCIHHRDFIPGMEIANNITNAIHTSRKTVIILSKNFLRSYWCNFEFNMARMESIYSRDGRNVVFLVFYGDITSRDLPLVMMELIDSQSYIEYPNDPQGNIVFWNKIMEAIST